MQECNADIIRLIEARLEKGRRQYGHGLIPNSGYDWVQEALEEALDLSIYVAARLVEVQKAESRSLSSQHPHDRPDHESGRGEGHHVRTPV